MTATAVQRLVHIWPAGGAAMSAREFGSECVVRPHLGLNNGYPWIQFRIGGARAPQQAARLVYRLFVGEVPRGQIVSYHCGNKACLNPTHLYLRGRAEAGADQGKRRRLAAEDYWYIRRTPLGCRRLAKKFNYSKGSITQIRRGNLGLIERFSLRYALLILWERVTRKKWKP